MEESVKSLLDAKKIDASFALGGCANYIQAPDVSWNKLFKALATEKYDKWVAEEGINQETPSGNLKPQLRRVIVNWVMEA